MDNPPDDGPCEVTITAPDREWLEAFVRRLVDDRLAAAGHVDTMATTYRWSDEVHHDIEARAVLHTTYGRLSEAQQRLDHEHPYEVPCFVAKALTAGSAQYMSWIAAAVRSYVE